MFVKFAVLIILIVPSGFSFPYRENKRIASRGRSRACSPPRLVNGFVTPLYKGKMMRFDCNKGYSRLGERYSECLGGRWSVYTFPICIKAGCPIIKTPENGKITYLNAKASAMLFCEPNYEAVGSSFAHCNGTQWDRTLGSCRETDNGPATFCDFESESICGWVHDTDHDFDFERRSGFNNKTISMVTGPHADHTTGIPFQGHYMVINTNTEVYTKRTRLISPLYKISAKTLCFKFYYHMYGINLGILRVYVKPESAEMQSILLFDDMESEARNDFVVFEMKGSQGNSWREGSGFIKPLNESFQIVIEAISGQTRLSDIAFDDVSIMSDDECIDGDSEDDDEKNLKGNDDEDDDNDGILSVESCVNRCFEDRNSTVQLNANQSLSCSCASDCEVNVSCCPDFLDVCFRNLSTLTASTTARMMATKTTKTSTVKLTTTRQTSTSITKAKIMPTASSTIRKTNLNDVKKFTSSTKETAPQVTPTVKVNQRMPQRNSMFNQTEEGEMNPTQMLKDYDDILGNIESEDDLELENDFESDNIMNERFMMKTNSDGFDMSFIIKASVIVISTISLSIIVFIIVVKQYKKSTNPLNYKEKQESASKQANEEFSEIRYLTSDETLDFNLASPDSVTDL